MASAKYECAVWWIRRDLRIDDNPAFMGAFSVAKTLIPLYIYTPQEEGTFAPGTNSLWWITQSHKKLGEQLKDLGLQTVFRKGQSSAETILQFCREVKADAVFFNHLYDPISLIKDHEVKIKLQNSGITCSHFNSDILFEPWDVMQDDGTPFSDFDTFNDKLKSMQDPPYPLPRPCGKIEMPPNVKLSSLSEIGFQPQAQNNLQDYLESQWSPGFDGAHQTLAKFIRSNLYHFGKHRKEPDWDVTSKLSPYMHMGEVSVRHIYYQVKQVKDTSTSQEMQEACDRMFSHLNLREYSRYICFHYPFTHTKALLQHLRACPWRVDRQLFKLWRLGMTGYPLIDASMRCLNSTGWIHNRLRVTVAAFLVKHLLLPWQWGLKYFWDTLVDADLESDVLGWQYVSGCLKDSPPFNQLLDMNKEVQQTDSKGAFVRKWLPQLARLPLQHLHTPWLASEKVLEEAGVEIGLNYPFRVVSTKESKEMLRLANAVISQALDKVRPEPTPFRAASKDHGRPLFLDTDLTELKGLVYEQSEDVSSRREFINDGPDQSGDGTGSGDAMTGTVERDGIDNGVPGSSGGVYGANIGLNQSAMVEGSVAGSEKHARKRVHVRREVDDHSKRQRGVESQAGQAHGDAHDVHPGGALGSVDGKCVGEHPPSQQPVGVGGELSNGASPNHGQSARGIGLSISKEYGNDDQTVPHFSETEGSTGIVSQPVQCQAKGLGDTGGKGFQSVGRDQEFEFDQQRCKDKMAGLHDKTGTVNQQCQQMGGVSGSNDSQSGVLHLLSGSAVDGNQQIQQL